MQALRGLVQVREIVLTRPLCVRDPQLRAMRHQRPLRPEPSPAIALGSRVHRLVDHHLEHVDGPPVVEREQLVDVGLAKPDPDRNPTHAPTILD